MVIKSGDKPVEIHESGARINRNMGFVVSITRRLGIRMTIYPLPERNKLRTERRSETSNEQKVNVVGGKKHTSP